METIPVNEFIGAVAARFQDNSSVYEIQRFLNETSVDPGSLTPYLYFNERRYTRNLIHRTEHFEVLALCWEPGQRSSIHDHSGQYCWMKVPIGILRVRNFSVVKHDLNIGYCKLTPTDTVEIQGQSAVDPTEPVHQVFNPVEFQEQAVSLHIYSKPIERFLMYEPTMDRCVISSPRNYSEYGQLCAPHARI